MASMKYLIVICLTVHIRYDTLKKDGNSGLQMRVLSHIVHVTPLGVPFSTYFKGIQAVRIVFFLF
jgi:hypothetical protein